MPAILNKTLDSMIIKPRAYILRRVHSEAYTELLCIYVTFYVRTLGLKAKRARRLLYLVYKHRTKYEVVLPAIIYKIMIFGLIVLLQSCLLLGL